MDHKPYTLTQSTDSTRYYFESVGKRGIFQKLIAFVAIENGLYNLALLDFDPENQNYSDISVTDNGDMERVLATVINAIHEFLEEYPTAMVQFTGSTVARTRLYKVVISKYFELLNEAFIIYGMQSEVWIPFEQVGQYDGFLVRKR